MQKHNFISKKLKKYFLSINDSIENYFNQIKIFKLKFKKSKFSTNNKVFLITGLIVISFISYFLLPTLFDKKIIASEIKNQIQNKYNINIKFNEKINYGLLPKPHFVTKNLSIFLDKKKIANVENFKTFISIGNFFSLNNLEIKDLIFRKADFNINSNDLSFFTNLLKTEPNENKIIIKNSDIFFKNENDEVLFINKIYNSQFYYDFNNLENTLKSRNGIFNLPFKLSIKNDKFNKKVFFEFNSKKIRLNLKNEVDYKDKIIKGLSDILLVNKSTTFGYVVKKNSINFNSKDTKNYYNGTIDLKPFYFSANFNYEGISSKNLFENESILFELIRSELFNNVNLNVNLNLKVKDITNISELNNLLLKISIEEGDINLSNSSIMWKDDLIIFLNDGLIRYDNNDIILIGRFLINVKDQDNFYSSFQIKKNYRKDLENIEFDFVYNFTKNKMSFDNLKINNKVNNDLDEFVNDYGLNEFKVFNKITFKNLVNNFFRAYSG